MTEDSAKARLRHVEAAKLLPCPKSLKPSLALSDISSRTASWYQPVLTCVSASKSTSSLKMSKMQTADGKCHFPITSQSQASKLQALSTTKYVHQGQRQQLNTRNIMAQYHHPVTPPPSPPPPSGGRGGGLMA